MLKLITLAMHFSPFNQGRLDPVVIEMLRSHLEPKPEKIDEGTAAQRANDGETLRKAA